MLYYYLMKKLSFICLIVLLCTLTNGCSAKSSTPLSHTEVLFDTVVTIQLYGTDDSGILDDCFTLCQSFEQTFSSHIETSEISRINNAGGVPVTVSAETLKLIQKGLYYSELSNGIFDITIAPLSSLWDFQNNTGTIPDAEALAAASAHVSYQNVIIDTEASTVCLTDPEAGIDLGGIAKGYIADRLKEFLVEQKVEHALINLGGNVLAVGGKPGGSAYNIGIQEPFASSGQSITSVSVSSLSVVTSGIYERYFEKEGKLYHHILNPQTGFPYETDLYGVTILSDSSTDGDALSTICLSLGLDEGLELINNTEGVEALFITTDNALHYSDQYPD